MPAHGQALLAAGSKTLGTQEALPEYAERKLGGTVPNKAVPGLRAVYGLDGSLENAEKRGQILCVLPFML